MIINQLALKRQSTVLLLLLVIVLVGVYSYITLPREAFDAWIAGRSKPPQD